MLSRAGREGVYPSAPGCYNGVVDATKSARARASLGAATTDGGMFGKAAQLRHCPATVTHARESGKDATGGRTMPTREGAG
jgi:hypothetical protein